MRLTTHPWRDVPIVLLIVAFLAAVLWPAFTGVRHPAYSVCLSNVKQSSIALLMYTSDSNDRFPSRDSWMDATVPYTKNEAIWHCSSVPKGTYGYALNGALSGVKQTAPKEPGLVPLIYDSVNPIRNASDLCTSLPLPGRHGAKQEVGRNNVGYADGHAKSVPARPVVK